MPGAQPHPQPRVQMKKAHEQVTTGSPKHSGIPCANGFNGFLRGLPGEPGLLPPSPAAITTGLIPASGYQDATTSPSATGAFVLCATRVHRIPPNVRDDGQRPSSRAGRAENASDLPVVTSECVCDTLARRANHLPRFDRSNLVLNEALD